MKTIIFDFDGTLLDSRNRHTMLLQNVCLELKVPLTPDQYNTYLTYKQNGYGTKSFLIQICNMPEVLADKCTKYWIKGIESWEYLKYDTLYSDSMDILKKLYGRFEIYLLSARQNEKYLYDQLEGFCLSNFFKKVFCVSPINAGKRKTEIAERLYDVAYFLGDTEADYMAASNIGCEFYALNRGFRSKEFWDKLNISSYSNFCSFLNIIKE